MHIGIITGEYPPMQGGVGAFSQIIAHTWQAQGHSVRVYADARAVDARVPITAAQGWGAAMLARVRAWARGVDVVNLQFQTAAFGMSPWVHALPWTLRGVAPVVTTFHDLRFPYLFPKAGPLRDAVVMALARHSAACISTNHEDAARLAHLPQHRMIPIGSNILPSDAHPAIDTFGSADGRMLVYFGFLNHSKGVETLLEALAILRLRAPYQLVMIGDKHGSSDPTNAAYARTIEAQIARLGLAQAVHWTGFVAPDMAAAYLAAAQAVVLPFADGASFRRGTLMAAIQHGAAIVTTAPNVSISEFRDGDNMLLTPISDAAGVAAAVVRLEDAALRARVRDGAAQLAGRFAWAHIAADTAALLATVRGR
jgi:glycosyltransferase involved in cell wall biosynthesis